MKKVVMYECTQKGVAYALIEGKTVKNIFSYGLTEDEAKIRCMEKYGAVIGKLYPIEESVYDFLDRKNMNGYNRKLILNDNGMICTVTADRQTPRQTIETNKKLSIILDMTCYDHLKALADDKGVTKSRIIMDLIDKAYEEMVEE